MKKFFSGLKTDPVNTLADWQDSRWPWGIIAFAMYSKLPMPRVDWEKKALSWALCWFPLVGLFIGAVLWLWLVLAQWLGFGAIFTAAFALLLPIALSGGIHLDGFCDTCDALSSHQSREKKLEILKDSHTGAFAIICCGLYLLVFFAAWCQVEAAGRTALVLGLGPVLSRSLSGLFAVTLPRLVVGQMLGDYRKYHSDGLRRVTLLDDGVETTLVKYDSTVFNAYSEFQRVEEDDKGWYLIRPDRRLIIPKGTTLQGDPAKVRAFLEERLAVCREAQEGNEEAPEEE